jgi:ribosomal protein S18 acetylase RimI-like enzyme
MLMPEAESSIRIRPLEDTDLGSITAIDEMITGRYRPQVWEQRLVYYMRRDPEASLVAERHGKVVGFMLGELRSGEFGLEEPTGWIEVLGVDPSERGSGIGRRLAEGMLAYFRGRGAASVRTLIDEGLDEIGRFFAALGFEPAPVRTLVKQL